MPVVLDRDRVRMAFQVDSIGLLVLGADDFLGFLPQADVCERGQKQSYVIW